MSRWLRKAFNVLSIYLAADEGVDSLTIPLQTSVHTLKAISSGLLFYEINQTGGVKSPPVFDKFTFTAIVMDYWKSRYPSLAQKLLSDDNFPFYIAFSNVGYMKVPFFCISYYWGKSFKEVYDHILNCTSEFEKVYPKLAFRYFWDYFSFCKRWLRWYIPKARFTDAFMFYYGSWGMISPLKFDMVYENNNNLEVASWFKLYKNLNLNKYLTNALRERISSNTCWWAVVI